MTTVRFLLFDLAYDPTTTSAAAAAVAVASAASITAKDETAVSS
jgi:hypothetical protein